MSGHVQDLWTTPGPDGKRLRNARWGHGRRWCARWTDLTGHERRKSFTLKSTAEEWLARVQVDEADGLSVTAGRAPLAGYIDRWYASRTCNENTLAWYRGTLIRVRARWEHSPVAKVTKSAVQEWVGELRSGGMSESRVHAHLGTFKSVMQFAVDDGARRNNPCKGISVPPIPRHRPRDIPTSDLARIVVELDKQRPENGTLALVLTFTGARWGELVDLRVSALDGRRLHLGPSISTVAGRQIPGDGKAHRHRDVVLPPTILSRITALTEGREPDDLLFPARRGGRWHHSAWRRCWQRACEQAKVKPVPTTHQMRHTAATLAIAAGADIKVVQEMVGHATATLTLDVYGHLRAGRLEAVADAMDADATAVLGL